jgi:hypothetical protein
MDVYLATTACAECKAENRVIMTQDMKSALCEHCGKTLLKLKRFDGVIYVMANKSVRGVKIGMTRKDAFNRAKQISGTGVPGQFEVLAAFPSHNPVKDERKVHEKLTRKRLAKEHFDLDPIEAIAKVRSILQKEWVYLRKSVAPAVEQKVEAQRAVAAGRFKKPSLIQTQTELFGEPAKQGGLEAARGCSNEQAPIGRPPKGFLASLFS